MKFFCYFFLFLATVSTPLQAQTITVKAAEHDDFTRVVFHLPNERSPIISMTQTGAELQFSKPVNLNSDGLFTRLYADRISAVTLARDDFRVLLKTDCDCDVKTFSEGPEMVIFDIRSVEKTTPKPRPISAPEPKLNLPVFPVHENRKILDTTAITSQLTTALKDAADRRILNKNQTVELISPESPRENNEIQTSLKSIDVDHETALTQHGDVCLSNEELDMIQWQKSGAFQTELTSLRNGLFDELDRLQLWTAENLVKFYISYGMETEAAMLLKLFAQDSQNTQLFENLIQIISQSPEPASLFSKSASCSTHAAVWGILASSTLSGETIDTKSVQLGINALPVQLRHRVGPQVMQKLIEFGHPELARDIGLQIESRTPYSPPALSLAQSQVAASHGDIETATTELESLAKDFSQISPEALSALISLKAKQNQPVTPQIAAIAETFAWEYENPENLHTDALAHLLAADFNIAISKFRAAPKHPEFVSQFAKLATENLPPELFVSWVLGTPDDLKHNMNQNISLQISRRLLDLGLPRASENFLVDAPIGDMKKQQAILLAHILFDQRKFDQSLAEISDINSPETNAIREKIWAKQGAWDQFANLDQPIIDPNIAAAAALKLGQTDPFEPSVPNHIGQLISVLEKSPSKKVTDKILETSGDIIDASASTREIVQNVLLTLSPDAKQN